MLNSPPPLRPRTATSALALAHDYLDRRGPSLAEAAELLGGPSAFGRCCRLIEQVVAGRISGRRLEHELRILYELLTLENVGDPSRDESGRFAALDLHTIDLDHLCRLAEELERLMRRVRAIIARQTEGQGHPPPAAPAAVSLGQCDAAPSPSAVSRPPRPIAA